MDAGVACSPAGGHRQQPLLQPPALVPSLHPSLSPHGRVSHGKASPCPSPSARSAGGSPRLPRRPPGTHALPSAHLWAFAPVRTGAPLPTASGSLGTRGPAGLDGTCQWGQDQGPLRPPRGKARPRPRPPRLRPPHAPPSACESRLRVRLGQFGWRRSDAQRGQSRAALFACEARPEPSLQHEGLPARAAGRPPGCGASPLPGVLLLHESEEQLLLPEAHRLRGHRQLLRHHLRGRGHREHGGPWLQPEQGLLPHLPRAPRHQHRRGVRGHPLLPELPVQHQRGRRAAGQHLPAGPGAPAQPAGPAAAWPLTPGP